MPIYRGDSKHKNKTKEMSLREDKKYFYTTSLGQHTQDLFLTRANFKKLQKKTVLTTSEKQKFKKYNDEIYRLERYCQFLHTKLSRFD